MSQASLRAALLAALVASGVVSAADPKQIYLVALAEPAATAFERLEQLGNAKRAANLEPTAISVTGQRRFDAKSASAKRYVEFLHGRQDSVLAAAGSAVGRTLTPKHRYDLVANGFAIELSASEAEALRNVDGIVSITPDKTHRVLTDAGPQWIGAEAIWNGTVQGSNIHTKGEGVVVGIIDGGINASHPSFQDLAVDGFNHTNPRGQRFGVCASGSDTRCNDKLIGIYDYQNERCSFHTGATQTPAGTDCHGHGTHVASTAAGNPFSVTFPAPTTTLSRNLSGVAPRASLISYKSCNEAGDCLTSNSIAALNQAVADAVDVVNFSISSAPTDPWAGLRSGALDAAAAFFNLRAAGIVPVVAAGNDGPGESTLQSVASSPWVITTAAGNSGRKFMTSITGISGHGVTTPFSLEGEGITSGTGTAQIVHGKDFGNALCGGGAATNNVSTCTSSSSNPFAPGSLAGKIVICNRGEYARVEKGCNAKLAGAVGMIIVNMPGEASNIVADGHFLPAVQLDATHGTTIRDLVEAARIGGGQITAGISAVVTRTDGNGDVLAGFSSRGPVNSYAGVLKPNVTAPGVAILAANHRTAGSTELQGTSMASPHITGAVALLLAGNPNWSVSQVESALVSTASSTLLLEDGVTHASYVDGGAGRARVDVAARAGLHFNVTPTQLRNADPLASGSPKALNLPSVHADDCFESCSFTRSATANVEGTWRVETVAPDGAAISVSPTEFSLGSGVARPLEITVNVNSPNLIGTWVDAQIKLIPTDTNLATTVLPVSVFATPGPVPEVFEIQTDSSNGFRDFDLANLVSLPDLTFARTALVAGQSFDRTIAVDTTNSDVYNTAQGTFTTLVGPTAAGLNVDATLIASTDAGNSGDIDLYVGIDVDGDGLAEEGEELCKSTNIGTVEQCRIDTRYIASAQRYWVHVQRYSGTASTVVAIETVHVPLAASSDASLAVTGPRVLDRLAPFKTRIAWNAPWLDVGKNAYALAYIGSTRTLVDNVGEVLVRIKRTATSTPAPIVLNGKADSELITLPAGVAHERIVIDVPPNATGLHLTTSGSGEVDLYLAKATEPLSPPVFAAAPARGLAAGSSIHAGATEAIDLLGAGLTPGRWYVTPVNSGATSATFTLSASMDFAAGSVRPVMQSYYNPARSGHGMFLSQVGNIWALVWYTYLEDGTPIWYYAQADGPTGNDGVWRVPLNRYTWNGSVPHFDTVGEIIMTFNSASSFTFSWLVNGQYGSEPFQTVAPLSCPNIGGSLGLYSGGWYQPGNGGWGFSVNALSVADAEAAYIFDANGAPRWLLGATAPGASVTIPLLQYTGFCPTCARTAAPTTVPAGTMTRTYASNSTGNLDINVDFADPVPGTWIKAGVQGKLTPDMACQ